MKRLTVPELRRLMEEAAFSIIDVQGESPFLQVTLIGAICEDDEGIRFPVKVEMTASQLKEISGEIETWNEYWNDKRD